MDLNSYGTFKYEWLKDKELNNTMIILLGVLNSLCKLKGYCWASNKYLVDVIGVNEYQIIKYIKKLKELGYIDIEMNKPIKIKNRNDDEYSYRQKRVITLTEKGIVNNEKEISEMENNTGVKNNTVEGVKNNTVINNNKINNSINNLSKDKSYNSATGAQSKRKQGVNIAPYIDAIDNYYPGYKNIKDAIINYIISVNRCRALWTMEEWNNILSDLYNSTSIDLPGTIGRKIIVNQVLEKIEFALKGNGLEPYMNFKNSYSKSNGDFLSKYKKGY